MCESHSPGGEVGRAQLGRVGRLGKGAAISVIALPVTSHPSPSVPTRRPAAADLPSAEVGGSGIEGKCISFDETSLAFRREMRDLRIENKKGSSACSTIRIPGLRARSPRRACGPCVVV